MASMFRRDPATRVTSLFREVFGEVAMKNPDATLEVTITAAAEVAGMDNYDMEALAQRLMDMAKKHKIETTGKPKGPRRTGSGFGDGFSKWVQSLDTDKLCLWLADYDFQKAHHLYSTVDVDDLGTLVSMKTEQTWQAMRAHFEACIIGAGGKLQGQSDATVYEVDMNDTESIDEMVQQMKLLGF